jgi:penicillin-binding protein 1A
LNTVPARVIKETLGIETSMDYLKNKFHFSRISDTSDCYLPPMAVGALTYGMTTVEMAAAYASFGNGGKYYEPYCYYKVTNSKGTEVILEHKTKSEQILSPATADVMCEILQTVSTSSYGTGSNVRKFPIYCKPVLPMMIRTDGLQEARHTMSLPYGTDMINLKNQSVCQPCG